ncbi:MAG: PAS domain S-box protein [Spirochaetes bacterium]|nr:PAS domain S-box protein [Spirochaetota bacterium]
MLYNRYNSRGRRRLFGSNMPLALPAIAALLVFLAGLFWRGAAAAQVQPAAGRRAVTIDASLAVKGIGPAVLYLEDREARLGIGAVATLSPAAFMSLRHEVPNFGLTSSAYWFRFVFKNPEAGPVSCYLEVGYPLLDDIILYIPDGRGGFNEIRSGDLLPFSERKFAHPNFVFPLKQQPGATTYYLRVRTTSAMSVPLNVYSREELYRSTLFDGVLNGIYYGMLIIMLIYNFFVFLSMKGRDYLYYVLFIGSLILMSLAFDGRGVRYFTPETGIFSWTTMFIFIADALYLMFTREFVATRYVAPLADKAILSVIAASAAAFAVNFALIDSPVMYYISLIVSVASIVVAVAGVIVTLVRGERSARFYLASLSFLIFGVGVYMLRAVALLPMNTLTVSVLKFSVMMHALVFSFGLSDKITMMRKRLEVLNEHLEREAAEHIRDKEALQRSEERFRGVIERNFDVIFMMDAQGVITYTSPSVTPLTGYRVDELIGTSFQKFRSANDIGLSMLLFGDLLKGKEVIGYEATLAKKDGTSVCLEVNLSPIMKEDRVTGIQGVARDITWRRLAEDTLREEKERLTITMSSIAEGVIATDTKWRVHLMNRAAEELTGWRQDEVIGKTVNDVLAMKDQKTGERIDLIKAGLSLVVPDDLRSNTLLVHRDGSERIVSERAAPIRDQSGRNTGYVIVIRDITEEVKFHGEILKIEKLESIGILAGGIAHDFNNILTAIIGNINLARLIGKDNKRLIEILDDAEKASARAQELTQQFLTFSRGGAPVRQIASAEEIIRDSSRFILRGSNVRSTFKFQEGLWPVNVDVGQFSQVIQNLVINADQAMPEGGDITIATENVTIGADSGLPLKPGRYVRISVGDTGVGIPAEHLQKVFDPYFTTKEDGYGLGLTSTFSIIKRHEGYISVESRVGEGTTFYLYLPTSGEAPEADSGVREPVFSGTGRVLFMDDDEAVNITARKMLEHIGFSVEIALDGREAVDLYEKSLAAGTPYDLVILDLTIPGGMGGKKTIELLTALDPGVKAIVSSGYSNDLIMANYTDYGFKGVIAKPYRIEELGKVIKQVLGNNT